MKKKKSNDGGKRSETALEKKRREGFERLADDLGLAENGENPDEVHAQLMRAMKDHCRGGYSSNNIKGLNFPLLNFRKGPRGANAAKKRIEEEKEAENFIRRRSVPPGTELPVPLQVPKEARINLERHIETLRLRASEGVSAEDAAYAASMLEKGLEGFDLRPEDLAGRTSYYKFPPKPVPLFMRPPDWHELATGEVLLSAKDQARARKFSQFVGESDKGATWMRKEGERMVDTQSIGILRRIIIMTPRAYTPLVKYRKEDVLGANTSANDTAQVAAADQGLAFSMNENHIAAAEYYEYDSDLGDEAADGVPGSYDDTEDLDDLDNNDIVLECTTFAQPRITIAGSEVEGKTVTVAMVPKSSMGRTKAAALPPSSVVCVELPVLEIGVKGAGAGNNATNWDRLAELNHNELRSLGHLERGVLLLKTSPVVTAAVE